ncbi:hypothetical protein GRI43_12435 [Altererythrobacter luteolus]|uniref:Uncharacterized protein n=1 Tax=Pontixanthobacter luteolus TaxID=295089 RepID=A0A6I4V3A7_9SPHN|nr:hypothetical protein [Pontixanthobacter luteolus]MXP48195.1 hypothetical protein [Pontixanthobacter luteolus]
MPRSEDPITTPSDRPTEQIGVLVGWDSSEIEGRIHLKLEYFPPGKTPRGRPQIMRLLLDRNEASVLGNYLYQITGEAGPARKPRRWPWSKSAG